MLLSPISARPGENRAIHIRDCVLCLNALQIGNSPVAGIEPAYKHSNQIELYRHIKKSAPY